MANRDLSLTSNSVTRLLAALTAPTPDTDYATGVSDLLALFGLRHGDATTDEVAMMIGSLRAHLQDNAVLDINWAEILKFAEAMRAESVASPTPARVITAVQGIIKKHEDATDHYLMEYDRGADQFQPLGGKQDSDDEPLTETLRREIMEELSLDTLPDLTATLLKADWSLTELSPTYGILTRYSFHFYHVTQINIEIPLSDDIHWITREAMSNNRTDDDRPVTTILIDGLGWSMLDELPPTKI